LRRSLPHAALPERPVLKRLEFDIGSTGGENRGAKDALVEVSDTSAQAGIGADRLTTCGLGATKPVASNDNATGRFQNRRVDLVRR
jgi:hypothetical protein